MGKTIMLSALIQTACDPDPPDNRTTATSRRKQLRLDKAFRKRQEPSTPPDAPATPAQGPSATLIVAPTSLLTQWHEELLRSSKPDTLKVLVWHGQNRLDLEALVEHGEGASGPPAGVVVITSYGTLVSEFSKLQSDTAVSPIFESSCFALSSLYLADLSMQLSGSVSKRKSFSWVTN